MSQLRILRRVAKCTYLPNPVDTDYFKADTIYGKKRGAITLNTEVTDTQWTLDYCKKNNIIFEIEVYDRTQIPIMYADMPDFLKQYSVYVDIRRVNGTVLENLSKTALEALACGLKVLDYKLEYQEGLPVEHNPKKVVSRLASIYSKKKPDL